MVWEMTCNSIRSKCGVRFLPNRFFFPFRVFFFFFILLQKFFSFIYFILFSGGWGKTKLYVAHHTSTYFHTYASCVDLTPVELLFFRCCEVHLFYIVFGSGRVSFRQNHFLLGERQPSRQIPATCPHLLACAVQQNNERSGCGTPVLKVVQGPRRPRCLCLVRAQLSPSDDLAKPAVLPVRLASWFTSFASIAGILHSRRKSTGTFCCTGYRRRWSRHVAFPAKKVPAHFAVPGYRRRRSRHVAFPGENVPAYIFRLSRIQRRRYPAQNLVPATRPKYPGTLHSHPVVTRQ